MEGGGLEGSRFGGGDSISSILENPKPVGTPGEGLLGRIRIKILTSDGNYCGHAA